VLRRLWGGATDDRLLWDWARDSTRHFEHDRIIVDLRGNGGGNDAITLEWITPVLPAGAAVPGTATGWYAGETPLGIWNAVAMIEASQGTAAVPSWHRDHAVPPTAEDTLTVRAEDDDPLSPGTHPWTGRMLVLVDRNTFSSGESSAWMLQHALGGRLVGGRTGGMIEYGNVVPYLLPASGLHVMLPTKHNDFGQPVEVVGLPVQAELDPRTSLAQVAAEFDDLYRAAGRTVTRRGP
jgi:Peptidase family S41